MSKKIVIAAILIFLGNVLCFPLWTELGYDGFWRTLFNKEARLELVYSGVITGDEPFHYQSTPKPSYSSWFYGIEKNVRWVSLNLRARGKWQKLSVQLEALRDGTITMLFRGADARDDYGRYYSIPTDWKNVKINGNLIFKETKALTFQKNFSKHIPVKKNEILHVEAEFRRHHFSIQDFTFLKSENLWYLTTGNLLVFFLIWRLFSLFGKHRGYLRLSDMLLVVTFFSLIFIPMVDISDEVNSVRENRMLAVKPSLKEILKGNMNTGGGV